MIRGGAAHTQFPQVTINHSLHPWLCVHTLKHEIWVWLFCMHEKVSVIFSSHGIVGGCSFSLFLTLYFFSFVERFCDGEREMLVSNEWIRCRGS